MKSGIPKTNIAGKRFGMLTALEYVKGGKWECLCDCGNHTLVDTRNLNSGHTTSCGCKIYSGENKKFKDYTGYENEWFKVLAKYGSVGTSPRTRMAWTCLCKNCGNEFLVDSKHMTDGKIKSCGCLLSSNEVIIRDMLTENNIEFSQQYTFPDLKSRKGKPLRFDFAIFNDDHTLSHLIEYNGAQHYVEVRGKWGEVSDLKSQLERDQLKKEYCEKNNIPLIVIPYYKKYTLSDLLLKNEPVETIPG